MIQLLAASQQQVTAWPQRLALTLLVIVVMVLAVWGMWRSWQKRAEVVLPVRPAPAQFTAELQVAGRYLGTSPADDWMQRVVANGMGAPGNATAGVGPDGVLLVRQGESEIFIASDQLTDAGIGRGVAAQVAERDGVVLWFWNAGDTALQSGFRPDVPEDVARLAAASNSLVGQEEK